jgi:hypothetical protein
MLKINTLNPCVLRCFKINLTISYEKVPSKRGTHLLKSETQWAWIRLLEAFLPANHNPNPAVPATFSNQSPCSVTVLVGANRKSPPTLD